MPPPSPTPPYAVDFSSFSLSVWLKARAHASSEIYRDTPVQTDRQAGRQKAVGAGRKAGRRQAGRETVVFFLNVLVEFSSIHSFTVPFHRFLIMACPHSGSAPLLSPPGCPSVHLRDRLRGLAVLTTV